MGVFLVVEPVEVKLGRRPALGLAVLGREVLDPLSCSR